jgi:hypothetical protein
MARIDRRRTALLLGLLAAGCSAKPGLSLVSNDVIASLRDVGTVPNPPGATGRDVGYSARFGGHSVWIFGDTFFAGASADGYHWRAGTWSFTDDLDAGDGLSGFSHALGADGKPRALLPHTPDEQAFDDAHNGTPCPAGTDCGARHTVWPGAFVVDPASGSALVFYTKEEIRPTGTYDFHAAGTSIATWASPAEPAVRPAVRPELPDPTVLFPLPEPAWGSAALVDGDTIHAYACAGGALTSPCLVARVAWKSALDRGAWRFWSGKEWAADYHAAAPVFDGAPLLSVHFSPHLHKFVAYYMVPLGSDMAVRTADRPEGPWSPETRFGKALPALDGNWDYGLFAHPELAGGKTETLSYFQPGKFLDGVVHLVEITYR